MFGDVHASIDPVQDRRSQPNSVRTRDGPDPSQATTIAGMVPAGALEARPAK